MTHPLIILIYSRTEDGSTYTNHRAAVLDGNMIIVTHTPATLAESIIIGKISGLYLIKELGSKGTPRNSVVRAYYEKRKAEGKTSQQALICISRRLISIIYGMLKNGTEYRMPVVENAGGKL